MKRRFWTNYRYFILAFTAIALLCTYSTTFQSIEHSGFGFFRYKLENSDRKKSVVLISIDENDLAKKGAWPWPRSEIAKLIRKVENHNPKIVNLLVDLSYSQTTYLHENLTVESVYEKDEQLRRKVLSVLNKLDTDRKLEVVLSRYPNVVLGIPYRRSFEFLEANKVELPQGIQVQKSSLLSSLPPVQIAFKGPEDDAIRIQFPLKRFLSKAKTIGLYNDLIEARTQRSTRLVHLYNNKMLPSISLSNLAIDRGVRPEQIKIKAGYKILLRSKKLYTGPNFHYYPKPVTAWNSKTPVSIVSASSILDGSNKVSLRRKYVFIALTAKALAKQVKVPSGDIIPYALWEAYSTQSLLNNYSVNVPHWFYGLQRGLILIVALYLLLLPRRLYGFFGLFITSVLSIVLLNIGLVAFLTQNSWLPFITPALFLFLSHVLITLIHRRHELLVNAQLEASSLRKELGIYYQVQGNLNKAFDQLKLCTLNTDEDLTKLVYTLGLDFERRRQFDKALEVYEHIKYKMGKNYRDIDARMSRLTDVAYNFPSSNQGNPAATQIMVIDDPAMEKPMLGRYQLEKEIGRGAMGMVYLGSDPKIGRKVAIKTLALGAEFEGKALEESEKRFFREAEAVGRLNHPNIVTIYDAGEDQDVAYIAMDFVEGESLADHIDPDNLLDIKTVIEIGVQVADALTYAHSQKVIHRDIKPANIIYNAEAKSLKVTDFGIAALTDDSKTRTGTILGSPSYMSPEQISGKKVTGHSDQFSLGTTLYQLLTGHLPFDGDSMANLMFQITSHTQRPIRKLRRGVPPCISRVINKALQKVPENRFSDCKAMSEALQKCLDQI